METIEDIDVRNFASKIGITEKELLRQSLISFVFTKLNEVKKELFSLQNKYGINTILEFEELYESGKIEEEDSRKDFQLFDRLSFQYDIHEKFLKKIL